MLLRTTALRFSSISEVKVENVTRLFSKFLLSNIHEVYKEVTLIKQHVVLYTAQFTHQLVLTHYEVYQSLSSKGMCFVH
jgi:hypothetical protein